MATEDKNKGIKEVMDKVNNNKGIFSGKITEEEKGNVVQSGIPENVYTDEGVKVNTTTGFLDEGNTTKIDKATNTIQVIEETDRFKAGTTLYINKKDTDYAKKSAFGTRGFTE